MTTNFVNVVGKYTLENVKELKDNIPVNENNIMDLTQAYIDESELNLKLNDYATKTFVLSETVPINEDINIIKNDLETKPSFDSMKNYTQEYVAAQIEENNNEQQAQIDTLADQINTLHRNKVEMSTFLNHTHPYLVADDLIDINSMIESQSLDIAALQDGKLDITIFETLDQSFNDFKDNVSVEHQNIYDKIDEIENNLGNDLSNEYATVNHIHDEYSLTTHTHTGFDEITVNKINNCLVGDIVINNSPERNKQSSPTPECAS